jgi:DNA-binding NtrC family response regulator
MVCLSDEEERDSVATALRTRGVEVAAVGTAAEAVARLASDALIDSVLVDAALPGGGAAAVLQAAAKREPFPFVSVVAGPTLRPAEAFALAQHGARELLERPLDEQALRRALPRDSLRPPPLDPVVRAYVGRVDLGELQRQVRLSALRQALALSDGSRSGAARLLRVTRQAVQHMLRGVDDMP